MTPARVALRAPAKLNLGLRLLARRADGYHEIETIFLPLRLFDELVLERVPGGEIALETDAPGVPRDASNLAVRAAGRALAALGLEPGLRLRLEKRIPVAAGLGGGSSDAAAALLGVEVLAGRRLPAGERHHIARQLGADVPFFLDPRPALGRGIGDRLEPLAGVPDMWWLLVCWPFPVATAEAYRAASAELTLPRQGSSIAALLGPSGVHSSPVNDLEAVTTRAHPELRGVRAALERFGASVTGMSGSGPTLYGRFEGRGAAEEAAERLELPPGAWTIVTSSPGSSAGDWGWGVAKR